MSEKSKSQLRKRDVANRVKDNYQPLFEDPGFDEMIAENRRVFCQLIRWKDQMTMAGVKSRRRRLVNKIRTFLSTSIF